MRSFNKIFFRGLVTIMPIAITIYLIEWIITSLENMVGKILSFLLPSGYYITGLGFLGALLLIFLLGLVLNNLVLQEVVTRLEKKLKEVPFIKAIYSPLRDLMNLFSKSSEQSLKSVVLVNLGNGTKMMGLVTRDTFEDLPLDNLNEKMVVVYCPLSYSVGGFSYLVPTNQIEPLNIPIEKAMSLAITGWVKGQKEREFQK
jgi:uncharacterized membrane protein